MKKQRYIRAWREKKGLTQEQIATAIGKTRAYVSMLEGESRGGSPEVLEQIAKTLGINYDDLARLPDDASPVPPAPFRMPVRAIVKAGAVAEAVEIPEVPIGWEPSLLPIEDGLQALEIHGDSMTPALEHGDRIVVDSRATPEDGDVVLAEYHDPRREGEPPELTVKMYVREGERVLLAPLNPTYETRVFDPRWWRIRGVAVKVICRHVRGRFRTMLKVGPDGVPS